MTIQRRRHQQAKAKAQRDSQGEAAPAKKAPAKKAPAKKRARKK